MIEPASISGDKQRASGDEEPPRGQAVEPAAPVDPVEEAAVRRFDARGSGALWSLGFVLGAQLLVLIMQWVCGGMWSSPVLSRMGSCYGVDVRGGHWPTLLTAGWLHLGLDHWVANAYGTVLFWPQVESSLGRARTFILFTLSSVGGFAFATLVVPQQDGVGASGGVLGLMAALLALSLRHDELIPKTSRAGFMLFAGIYLVLNFFASLKSGVSMAGHAGGALTAAALVATHAITVGMPPLDARAPAPRGSRLFARAVAVALVGMTAYAFAIHWKTNRPWICRFPPASTRVALAGTPLSFDVPPVLAAMEAKHGDGYSHFWFGTLRSDPIAVSVIVRDHDADGEMAPIEALHLRLVAKGPEEDTRWRTQPSIVSVGGKTFVFIDQVIDDSEAAPLPRWVTVEGNVEFDVQITLGESNRAWREIAMAMPGTLRSTGN